MKIVWTLPVPSTALIDTPVLIVLPRRCCELRLRVEGGEQEETIVVAFEQVISYKCTYDWGCSAEIIHAAYDKLVDYGNTKWLTELAAAVQSRNATLAGGLKHLGIYFDDGPHYEFICGDVRIAAMLPKDRP